MPCENGPGVSEGNPLMHQGCALLDAGRQRTVQGAWLEPADSELLQPRHGPARSV